ncbi:MAG: 50S ribosomal protein L25/general stress protein Ctc [Rhizobiales bacterium]|nr:50S ribosomal protein L25/general stress protein Ctc [Hyphomicrobiales bacterium]
MTSVKELKATVRSGAGRGPARAERREGRTPGVIYGDSKEPLSITLDHADLRTKIYAGRFLTTIYDIDIDGKKHRVIPRDYQLDKVKGVPIHVDFMRLGQGATIRVNIPIRVRNAEISPGVKRGGAINIVTHTIEVRCPADAIPSAIEVDVAELDMNHSLHLSSVTLPPNVKPVAGRDLTLVTVPLTVSPDGPAATAAITRLRERLAPSAFSGVRADVLVTGETAYNVDDFATVDAYTPWVFAFVLGLSFLLLLIAFRSIVVPLKAIVMNLLSVGAAYGLLVLVFQKGYGDSWFGFEKTPGIESWLPLFLFAILFGLSMDYHVFLLSRIREHYDRTRNNRESVAVGLQATGKIITSAALIMVAVFSGFATGRLSQLQQAGFGLAVAILLDATLVRAILVPAAMALLGDRNWYLPAWLRWLPDLRLDAASRPVVVPLASSGDD